MKIKHEKCPECGSRVKSKSEFDMHCSGHWNERVIFECGCEYEFSPNFMQVLLTTRCPNNAEAREKVARRRHAKSAVLDMLGSLECDSEFYAELREAISRLRVE